MGKEKAMETKMKKIALFLTIMFLAVPLWAAEDGKEVESVIISKCPIVKSRVKTATVSDCLKCHTAGRTYDLIETAPDAGRVYPFLGMRVITEGKTQKGYYLLQGVLSYEVSKFFDYLDNHNITRAVIEIHSPGGSLFDAQRIVSLIQHWQSKGGKVETRLYGAAFSAGFYIFVSGDNRLVSESADLMWHEIQSFSGFGFKVDTPSDKEEAARILRHLQDVRHKYLATRGKLTKEQIDQRVFKKEWWMSGPDAVELGFADGLITGKK